MKKFFVGDIVTVNSVSSSGIIFEVLDEGRYDKIAKAMFYRLKVRGTKTEDFSVYALTNAEFFEYAEINPLLDWLRV
jgi:hypothetical protein